MEPTKAEIRERFITLVDPCKKSSQDEIEQFKQYIANVPIDLIKEIVNEPVTDKLLKDAIFHHPITLLAKAVLSFSIELVVYLIKTCQADIEQITNINNYELWDNFTFFTLKSKTTPYTYDGLFNIHATVLWHTCRSGSVSMFRSLIACGANVNSQSETQLHCTPLMVACAKNRICIVRNLVLSGADVNLVDVNNENCLFYAVRHNEDCLPIVKYLLSVGCNLFQTNNDGETVLNFVVDLVNSSTLNYVIKYSPIKFSEQNVEYSLLRICLNGDSDKFSSLFDYTTLSTAVRVDILKLIGVRLGETRDYSPSLMCWDISVDEMSKLKKQEEPRVMQNFLSEYRTHRDLKRIEACSTEFVMQSLWIKETLLHKYKEKVHVALRFNLFQCLFINLSKLSTAHILPFSIKRFDKLNTLWLYTLSLQLKYLKPLDKSTFGNLFDFCRYIKCVSADQSTHKPLSVVLFKLLTMCMYEFKRVVKATVYITEHNKFVSKIKYFEKFPVHNLLKLSKLFDSIDYSKVFQLLSLETPNEDCFDYANLEFLYPNVETLLTLVVYLLKLFFCHIHTFTATHTTEQISQLKQMIKILGCFTSNLNSTSLSLLSVVMGPPVSERLIMSSQNDTKFPDNGCDLSKGTYRLVKYLLTECRLDPNQLSGYKTSTNTCLNANVFFQSKELADKLIVLFLEHGAHFDFTDDKGKDVAANYKKTFNTSIHGLVQPFKHTTLKCLASKAIKRYGILQLVHILPKELSNFVSRH